MCENETNEHISYLISSLSAEGAKGGPANSNLIPKENVREELQKMFNNLIKGKENNEN